MFGSILSGLLAEVRWETVLPYKQFNSQNRKGKQAHHIHQSAAYRTKKGTNPNHRAGHAVLVAPTKHGLATAFQMLARKTKQGFAPDKFTHLQKTALEKVSRITGKSQMAILKDLKTGDLTHFQDRKAYYALIAAGINPQTATKLKNKSKGQIKTSGTRVRRIGELYVPLEGEFAFTF